MKIVKIFIILYFSLLALPSFSQSTINDSLSYYLNNGGLNLMKNIIKVNLLSIIPGDLTINYERVISDRFFIEAGLGILLPYYVKENDALLHFNEKKISPKIGYSFKIFPKLSYGRKAPDCFYGGLLFRRREYFLENDKKLYNYDLSLQHGLQRIIKERIIIDFNLGIGIRIGYLKQYDFWSMENYLGFAFPSSLSIGYKF